MSDTIDLNSAAIEQLNRLPGINDELAGRIVSYRDEHGPFGSLDDLRHVAGINDAIVQDLFGRTHLANRPPPVALRTYTAIRVGVVAVIVALGFAVWREIATSSDQCVQRSLSAYYYTPAKPVFVGALLIIGFAMIAMWGMTWWEDAALNLAGLLLMVVALVPTLDANYCSLPKAIRGQSPETKTKQIADNALIKANAEAVGRSFTSLLFIIALVLLVVAVAAVMMMSRPLSQNGPTNGALIGYAVTWLLAVAAWVVYFVLYQDAGDPDSTFNHKVHSWSANLAVAFIILAVVFAAVHKARSNEPAKTKWVWFYGLTAATMMLTALVIKVGDHFDLFSGWVDNHATFLLEAILIALLGIFWVLQTIDRRAKGAPAY